MKHWDNILTFYRVAQAGSFTRAAEQLNISQSALSRTVMLLEYHLKTRLFHRQPRGVSLTSEGQLLYEAADKAFAQLHMAEIHLKESDTPQGVLRVATAASSWLLPSLHDFQGRYPDLSLRLHEMPQDAHAASMDVLIGPSLAQAPEMIHRSLTTLRFQFYGSPSYLAEHGLPQSRTDLDAHVLLMPTEQAWPLQWDGEDKPTAAIAVPSLGDLRTLALVHHKGLALLPEDCLLTAGLTLAPVPTVAPTLPLFYSYPQRLRASVRVTALYHHLQEAQAA